MRPLIYSYGILAIGCTALVSCKIHNGGNDVHTNLIIILVDDMGYGDLGCYGNEEIKTPNIDRMAAEGIRFTDFHSNSAVCTPTRVALLTGRYQQRAGLQGVFQVSDSDAGTMGLAAEEVTFASVMKEAGYKTAIFGKWHVGELYESHPLNQGFDEFIGFQTNPDFFSHSSRLGDHDWWHGFDKVKEEGYITYLISEYSIDYIRRNKDNPFCLYIAHKTPHGPLQGPSDTAIWKENERLRPLPTCARPGEEEAVYREMIESLDDGIGDLLDVLEETGLDKNTLILFFSDNGPVGIVNTGNLRGRKGTLYEGGHRVPAIARWPGVIEPGVVSDQTLMGMDVFPTLTDIAGIDYEPETGRELDGISFLPLFYGDSGLPERTLFWRTSGGIAIRQGEWKLVNQRGADNPENAFMLFNLEDDISESKDLAMQYPDLVNKLLGKLKVWESDVDSYVPAINRRD